MWPPVTERLRSAITALRVHRGVGRADFREGDVADDVLRQPEKRRPAEDVDVELVVDRQHVAELDMEGAFAALEIGDRNRCGARREGEGIGLGTLIVALPSLLTDPTWKPMPTDAFRHTRPPTEKSNSDPESTSARTLLAPVSSYTTKVVLSASVSDEDSKPMLTFA